MTNGSSQGLFVVVAVVIFGIFVVLSYLLFRDKLQTGLASIFSDSITEASQEIIPFTKLYNFLPVNGTFSEENGEYLINVVNENTTEEYPSGLRNATEIKIDYNKKLVLQYEVYYEGSKNLTASVDYNAYTENISESWHTSDNYGSTSAKESGTYMYRISELKPNVWNTVTIWYANDSNLNVNNLPLVESTVQGSVLGVQKKSLIANNISKFKIRNIQYKVVDK